MMACGESLISDITATFIVVKFYFAIARNNQQENWPSVSNFNDKFKVLTYLAAIRNKSSDLIKNKVQLTSVTKRISFIIYYK